MGSPSDSPFNQPNGTLPYGQYAQTVSWQSAFWALVPFAINSMTQPAGRVCGAPEAVCLMLRSSPIICVIDTIFIIARLAYCYYHTTPKDLAKAHAQHLRSRFYHGGPKNEGSLHNLQKNQIFRLVVFFLTVSQLIKLYACEGVTGTKIVASMYLGSFLIIEALVAWPQAQNGSQTDTPEPQIKSTGRLSLPYVSTALAVAFMLSFAAVALKDILGEPYHTLPQWTCVTTFILGNAIAIPALGFLTWNCSSYEDVVVPAILLLVLVVFPLGSYGVGLEMASLEVHNLFFQIMAIMLVFVWTALALVFASETSKAMTEGLKAKDSDRDRDLVYEMVDQITAFYFFFAATYDCFIILQVLL